MNLRTLIAAAFGLLALSANAGASDAVPASVSAQIDRDANVFAQATTRSFGKAVAYCATQHQPPGMALDERLKTLSSAVATGSREALLQIVQTDPALLQDVPVPGPAEFENFDKQGDQLLQKTQSSPAQVCAKLAAIMDQGNSAFFKDLQLKDNRAYQAKRAQFCARQPRPDGCD
jgi:hypothetical protein